MDGELHDELRSLMNPPLQRPNVLPHIGQMWRSTDQIAKAWKDGESRDMLVEMRKIALLILVGSLFSIDFTSRYAAHVAADHALAGLYLAGLMDRLAGYAAPQVPRRHSGDGRIPIPDDPVKARANKRRPICKYTR